MLSFLPPGAGVRATRQCGKGQKSWNGVAILGRGAAPIVTRTELPGDPTDAQSRYIEAAVSGVLVASLYAPNGNPQPGPKFDYKLAWMKRLNRHAATLLQGWPRTHSPARRERNDRPDGAIRVFRFDISGMENKNQQSTDRHSPGRRSLLPGGHLLFLREFIVAGRTSCVVCSETMSAFARSKAFCVP